MPEGLTNGNVVRLNYAEKRLDALEPTVHGLERDVAEIKRSNISIAEDVSEIKETLREAADEQKRIAEGKQQLSALQKAGMWGAGGAVLASLIASAATIAGG